MFEEGGQKSRVDFIKTNQNASSTNIDPALIPNYYYIMRVK